MRFFRHHILLLSGLVLVACTGVACTDADESADPGEEAIRAAPPATAPDQTPPSDPVGSLPRVVTLGTSLTAGYGLDDPLLHSWPARLQDRAREEGIQVQVVNAGVSGETSAGGLRRIEWLLQEPVDLLIVELGANDGLRGQPVEAMEANLDSIVVRTRRRWPEARIALVPMEAPTNLGPDYTGRFRTAFRQVAERHDVLLLPFILEGIAGIPELNQGDGIHPTREGHRRMLDNLWGPLRPLLDSIGSGAAR